MMNGITSGTSIHDLRKNKKIEQYENLRKLQDMQNQQYGAMHNLQHEQGHNSAHHVQQLQHIPYYNMENNTEYPQFINNNIKQNNDIQNIEDLAKDISENLPGNTAQRSDEDKKFIPSNITFAEIIKEENIPDHNNGGYLSKIPDVLREPLIIITLFLVLSQPVIRNNFGKYIEQINPDQNGNTPFVGMVIYGVFFAILFAILKKILIK
jgi:hypothetical protein